MFDNLLLHEDTKRRVLSFCSAPSQGLLLTGEKGTGKQTLALALTAKILGLKINKLSSSSAVLIIKPSPSSISIESIRAIKKFLQLKTIGKAELRRVVIINDAQTMTHEAQNALLKLLEEPPEDTMIVLTAENKYALLPTITSRAVNIDVKPTSLDKALTFFKTDYQEEKIEKNYRLSQGNTGLLSSLLSDDKSHPLVTSIEEAKEILKKPVYIRLGSIEELVKDKIKLTQTLDALYKLIHAALVNSLPKNDNRGAARLTRALKIIKQTETAALQNANPKLAITHLLINV